MQKISKAKIFGIGIALLCGSVFPANSQVDVRLETQKAAYLQFSGKKKKLQYSTGLSY
jgi:hypothetical protein